MSKLVQQILIPACAGYLFILIALLAAEEEKNEQRRTRQPNQIRHSQQSWLWQDVQNSQDDLEGWYISVLRCTAAEFAIVVQIITTYWPIYNPVPAPNSTYAIRDRLAMTIHYLTHQGGMSDTARLFGCSVTSVHRYVDQILLIVTKGLYHRVVVRPATNQDWVKISEGFEQLAGMPGCVGAIDGSLLMIERPRYHEGFYNRKSYTSLNMQSIVDSRRKVYSLSIRPGSWNDAKVFKFSTFGTHINSLIPAGTYIVADAGYKLLTAVLTPYDILPNMSDGQSYYNNIHSKTRMPVEGAFGLMKERFRILKSPLEHLSHEKQFDIVVTVVVFHNLYIDLRDGTLNQNIYNVNAPIPPVPNEVVPVVDGDPAKAFRDNIKDYLVNFVRVQNQENNGEPEVDQAYNM